MRLPVFLKGSLLLTLAMLFSRGAVVLASAMVAQAFGVRAFAVFTFVHLTATTLSNLAMLGMMNGLPRFCARLDVDTSADALSQALLSVGIVIVGLSIAIAAVLFLPADLIGLPDPAQKAVLAALTLCIGLTNLLVGINNGFERFGQVTISSFGLGLILIGGTYIAVLLDAPEWPLRAYLIATIVAIGLLIPAVVRRFVQRYKAHGASMSAHNVQEVRSYLGPMLLATMLTNTGLWLAGRVLIGGPDGTSAYAQFALGMQWFGLAQMASNVISRTIMPRLTRNVWRGDTADQRQTLRSALVFSILGAVAMLMVVVLLSPLVPSFYGAELADAYWSLILFLIAAVVAAPVTVLSSALIAEARYNMVFVSTLAWWTVTIVGTMLLAHLGSTTVIACTLVGYLVQLAMLWLHPKSRRV